MKSNSFNRTEQSFIECLWYLFIETVGLSYLILRGQSNCWEHDIIICDGGTLFFWNSGFGIYFPPTLLFIWCPISVKFNFYVSNNALRSKHSNSTYTL